MARSLAVIVSPALLAIVCGTPLIATQQSPDRAAAFARMPRGEPDLRGTYASVGMKPEDCDVHPLLRMMAVGSTTITQSRDYVVLSTATLTRVVPLWLGGHASADTRRYLGLPQGRWEGDTLVVESAWPLEGSHGSAADDTNAGMPRLLEQITLLGADELRYDITEDRDSSERSFSASFRLVRRSAHDVAPPDDCRLADAAPAISRD